MDEVGQFIADLTDRQEPLYQEIGQRALERWNETRTISPKMARWIKQSAKFKGMNMPDELKALVGECSDETGDANGDRTEASKDYCSQDVAHVVLLEELSFAYSRAAERLRNR
jgi:hypothetical protein